MSIFSSCRLKSCQDGGGGSRNNSNKYLLGTDSLLSTILDTFYVLTHFHSNPVRSVPLFVFTDEEIKALSS